MSWKDFVEMVRKLSGKNYTGMLSGSPDSWEGEMYSALFLIEKASPEVVRTRTVEEHAGKPILMALMEAVRENEDLRTEYTKLARKKRYILAAEELAKRHEQILLPYVQSVLERWGLEGDPEELAWTDIVLKRKVRKREYDLPPFLRVTLELPNQLEGGYIQFFVLKKDGSVYVEAGESADSSGRASLSRLQQTFADRWNVNGRGSFLLVYTKDNRLEVMMEREGFIYWAGTDGLTLDPGRGIDESYLKSRKV